MVQNGSRHAVFGGTSAPEVTKLEHVPLEAKWLPSVRQDEPDEPGRMSGWRAAIPTKSVGKALMTTTYELTDLEKLEAEAVHIFREVAATIERPGLLFSGGKDSVVMLHLAVKAFWPARVPFPVMHVDTGQNFDEVIEFRDNTVDKYGLRLIVEKLQDDIDAGRIVEEYPGAPRNRHQTVTLLRAISENQFGAVFGGARRDEEKARAKER